MSPTPLVSVLMTSYNHERYIGRAIDSLLAQRSTDWELIVCDDASTDRTRDVLARYADPRIRCIFNDVNRRRHPRNAAYGLAQGRFIAILNSDDCYRPDKLARQTAFLDEHPAIAAVFTHVDCIDDDDRALEGHPLARIFNRGNQDRHAWLRHFFDAGNALCLPSVLIRREALPDRDPFDPVLIQLGDFDLWIRLCLAGEIHILPERLTAMRIQRDGGNLSADTPAAASRRLLELLRVYRRYLSAEALGQLERIFPDLDGLVPARTAAWQWYLVCQRAARMEFLAPRLFGFQAWQQLVDDAASCLELQQQHPRVMSDFFAAIGGAGLTGGEPMACWRLGWAADGSRPLSEVRYWKQRIRHGRLTFSIARLPGARRLSIRGDRRAVIRKIRVYEQRSGSVVHQSAARADSGSLDVDLPASVENGDRWLQVELDLAPAPRWQFWR
jgi:glycosyltransferase involved in cell wall biosynthesis